ncbi:hypothetical protein V1264_016423 [Littorina saxatilis]|uniref:Secreted protein n=1 Tax=Littorina saxatilis TaxID=31220 RepID=A0AAN9BM04_9CAEN
MLLNAVLLISLCVQCLHIAGAVSNEGARAQRETRSVETEGQGGPLYTALCIDMVCLLFQVHVHSVRRGAWRRRDRGARCTQLCFLHPAARVVISVAGGATAATLD